MSTVIWRAVVVSVALLCVTACGDDAASVVDEKMNLDMSAVADLSDNDMIQRADMAPALDMSAPVQDSSPDASPPVDQGAPDDMAQDMMPGEDMTLIDMMRSDMTTADMAMPDMPAPAVLYVGMGDVFVSGPLQVTKGSTTVGNNITLSTWAPSQAGEYAVIVFHHGFLLSTAYYDTLLTHIASHGFIIAAPQMYAPGDNPFGKPSAAEEAASARTIWQNLGTTLPAALPTGVTGRVDRLGVVGHSRGSKVIWINLVADATLALAAVGLDPVDGTGGGFNMEPRAIPAGGVPFSKPSLFVGTGLGPTGGGAFTPSCAPEADGYKSFFAGAQSPAYELVATEYGHLDMLEDQPAGCGFTCRACEDGAGARDLMRRASAGWTVALMRDALQGSDSAMNVLTNPALAPALATGRSK